MGIYSNSTSKSSSQSNAKTFIEGEQDYLKNRGKDTEGISEKFQYHDSDLTKLDIKLSQTDKFFRETFRPMHLMNFKLLNKILDKFVEWSLEQHMLKLQESKMDEKSQDDSIQDNFDSELILYQ